MTQTKRERERNTVDDQLSPVELAVLSVCANTYILSFIFAYRQIKMYI